MKIINGGLIYCIFTLGLLSFGGCIDEPVNNLSVSQDRIEFNKGGSDTSMTIQTDADSWIIENPADWIVLSNTAGTGEQAVINMSVTTKTIIARTATLTITAGTAKPVKVIASQQSSDYLYTLTADKTTLSFKKSGNMSGITISSEAPEWKISSEVDWLQLSQASGNKGNTTMNITALENTGDDARIATITITAEYAPSVHISVSQNGDLYPDYNSSPLPPDASGMISNASELAASISLGWNLGNSLEAIGGETAWGNPRVTKAFIDLVKQSGFNAVRIPCSWNQHMANSSTAQLKTDWLNRVKEVIQYCVDNDMYVLLNIHWDGGWLENNCTVARQEENNAKQKAFWEQIATHLRDFDEHLLFAGANEPNVENAGQMAVLKSYHQTFINAVRSTGGRNSYRVLVIQGPSTDIDKTYELMSSLPVDSISNRLMAEIHYYTPWNFCGMTEDASWGNMFYYWGSGNHSAADLAHNPTWGEEDAVNSLFQKMKNQFVNKGIPVILGEYAPVRRSALTGEALTKHQQSRAYYLKYVTMKAKENGIIPFYWDNGGSGNYACGIFNRNTNSVSDQQALDALVEGATN